MDWENCLCQSAGNLALDISILVAATGENLKKGNPKLGDQKGFFISGIEKSKHLSPNWF